MDNLNINEIERIQAEIEKDLQKAWQPDTTQHTLTIEPEEELEIKNETEEEIIERPTDSPAPPLESFYRETIKITNPEAVPVYTPSRSFPRTLAIVFLICTFGTASLGFGLGTAGVYTRHYMLGGINGVQYGENAETYEMVSTRYAFNDITAIPSEGSLSDMIKLVEPSVVGISSSYETVGRFGNNRLDIGEGSGILFSEDSDRIYIATNYHVVGGADEVYVAISGSEPIKASPVGGDGDADLYVLSVAKSDLRAAGITNVVIAVFGDSDAMEVGDVVLAIGNAMGEGNSATRGIISAKERIITIENRTLTMLQTDAAINQGNSGGPLINTRGEVIGINTAKFSSGGLWTPSVEGMGYSISTNIAKPILEELMNRTSRPALGIYAKTVTKDLLDEMEYDIPPIGGVIVDSIIRNSGADKAGIRRTDIITGFNGNPILTMEQLIDEIRKCQVGDTVEVKILRNGKEALTLQVTLGEVQVENF